MGVWGDVHSLGGLPRQPALELCLQLCLTHGLTVWQAQGGLSGWNVGRSGRQVTVGAAQLTWLQ